MKTTVKTDMESPIAFYFQDLQGYPLIDREHENRLARQYRRDENSDALNALINSNLRLVVKIAKDFWRNGDASLADLIQEGNIGLVRAARRFNPSKKVKFSYYASFWIKAYIYKYLMDNTRSVRLGTTQAQRKLFFNLNKTKAKLVQEGIRPTPGKIARRLNVKKKEVVEMEKRLAHPDVSLNAPVPGLDGGSERGDLMPSPSSSVEDEFAKREYMSLIRESIGRFKRRLSARETAILERRILSVEPLTLRTLGERYGVSRERIRQIESRIIRKFKEYLLSTYPDVDRQAFQPAE